MASERIDAHHHFWNYSTEEYGWISDRMERIRRDFLPADLAQEIGPAGIDGVVSVQARQTVSETDFLLGMARANSFIRGVVGWVPLVADSVGEALDRYVDEPKLKAVRHVLHDESDDSYMLRDDFNRGIGALAPHGLAYDILIFERHLPQTIEFVDRHPSQVFIVDHVAKPRIGENVLEPWRQNMIELGRRENVFCKVSGLVAEADWNAWTEQQLRPYIDTALEAFGPKRLMFGSDWPVCLVACEYRNWAEIVRLAICELSADEQDRILGGTAIEAYRL
jgi:L-fuconolactonase